VRRAAKLITDFRIEAVAADAGGNGSVLNRELLRLARPQNPTLTLFGIHYAQAEGRPQPGAGGAYWRWTVDRTAALGDVFTRIHTQTISFPSLAACGDLLGEFWVEQAEYDRAARQVRYFCPAGLNDDLLHACAYSLRLSSYLFGHRLAAG
jgi:hypothetical protein